jgi:hypothetical protein
VGITISINILLQLKIVTIFNYAIS